MINEIIYEIKRDLKLYNYLKYHSNWYYILSYDRDKLKDMIKEMKEEYKDTVEDKLENLNNKMKFIGSIIDILK